MKKAKLSPEEHPRLYGRTCASKSKFKTRTIALAAIERFEKAHPEQLGVYQFRVYSCQFCSSWHIEHTERTGI